MMDRLSAAGLVAGLLAAAPASAAEPGPTFYSRPGSQAPFSPAVRVGDVLYLSGAIGLNADGKAPEVFEDQVRNAMDGVKRYLGIAGADISGVFKCTVFLQDVEKFDAFTKVYTSYFKPGRLPALTATGNAKLVYGSQLEIECLAYAPTAASDR